MNTSDTIINIAGYKFAELPEYAALRPDLRKQCEALELKGTILLSPEGLNAVLAGSREAIEQIKTALRALPGLADLEFKESLSQAQPFARLLVKLKKEIISLGREEIKPAHFTGPALSAKTLKQWLDEGRDFTLLDTRNTYEVQLGSFKRAMQLNIQGFRQFPEASAKLDPCLKDKPLVMFCTGGVRCEKASPLLLAQGFKQVYQLDGGILKYFEECAGAHWDGECFVFDERVGLGPDLKPHGSCICPSCHHAVSAEQQQSPDFLAGVHCPHCP